MASRESSGLIALEALDESGLAQIVDAFSRFQIPCLVTGSVASMAYDELRLTNDIDIVSDIRESHIPGLLAAFPAEFFYLREESIQDAIRTRGLNSSKP